MKRIVTLETRDLAQSLADGGCGECQTSCQSACKTSCGVANQQCEYTESYVDEFRGRIFIGVMQDTMIAEQALYQSHVLFPTARAIKSVVS